MTGIEAAVVYAAILVGFLMLHYSVVELHRQGDYFMAITMASIALIFDGVVLLLFLRG